MLHTFAAKWISGSVISKRLTQEVMSSFAESSIAVVRFTRPRSCMCFKRGGTSVSSSFFMGEMPYTAGATLIKFSTLGTLQLISLAFKLFAFYTVKKLFGFTKLVS